MEIVTMIVAALAAGASASVKKIGGDVIQSAYDKLKAAVAGRTNRHAALEALQEDPQSAPQRQVIEQALQKSGAGTDAGLAQLAAELDEALARLPQQSIEAIGVDVREIEARNITFRNIMSSGTSVRGERWKATEDITLEGIGAGVGQSKN